jgi:hypothetical protein
MVPTPDPKIMNRIEPNNAEPSQVNPNKVEPNIEPNKTEPNKIEQIIQVLQQDLPTLFEQDISYDIYAPTIYFRDPVNSFKGKLNYRIIFWTLRFHGRLFFTELFFDLHQVAPATEISSSGGTIRADWTVRGTLRLPWKPKLFFNGYSIYKLDSQGVIYEHIDTWDRSPEEILKQFIGRTS